MENRLLELTGNASIIFTAICDFDLEGVHYNKGDLVLYIDDCTFRGSYNNVSSSSNRTGATLYYDYSSVLNKIFLNRIPLREEYLKLFGMPAGKSFEIPKMEKAISFGNKLFLLNTPANPDKIRIKNHHYPIKYNSETNTITTSHLEDSKQYEIYYTTLNMNTLYDMSVLHNDLPYLHAEIELHGNQNKNDSTVFLDIPKVKLGAIPQIENGSGYFGMQVTLNIIEDKVRMAIIDGNR